MSEDWRNRAGTAEEIRKEAQSRLVGKTEANPRTTPGGTPRGQGLPQKTEGCRTHAGVPSLGALCRRERTLLHLAGKTSKSSVYQYWWDRGWLEVQTLSGGAHTGLTACHSSPFVQQRNSISGVLRWEPEDPIVPVQSLLCVEPTEGRHFFLLNPPQKGEFLRPHSTNKVRAGALYHRPKTLPNANWTT